MTLNPSNTHGQVECSVSVVTVTLNPIHTDRVFCESAYHDTEPDTQGQSECSVRVVTITLTLNPIHTQNLSTYSVILQIRIMTLNPQDAHRHVEKKP